MSELIMGLPDAKQLASPQRVTEVIIAFILISYHLSVRETVFHFNYIRMVNL